MASKPNKKVKCDCGYCSGKIINPFSEDDDIVRPEPYEYDYE